MNHVTRLLVPVMLLFAAGCRPTPPFLPTSAQPPTPALPPTPAGPTALVAGDIAIIGFNFGDTDELAFVLLREVGAGTQITFTDNGWQSTHTFRTGEGAFTWVAPTALAAGTVIAPTVSGVSFSNDGDQVLAYQGAESSPTFLYAVNSEGAAVWQADATDSHTSALPNGLVNGSTAIALNETDHATYSGSTADTPAALLATISNAASWSGSGAMPTGPFTVTGSVATNPTPVGATPLPTTVAQPTNPAAGTQTGSSCPVASITSIGAIQGTGTTSSQNGDEVTIQGVVVGDFQASGELDGFFVQDAGDGNPNTSDGIFVESTTAVSVGNPVQVSGRITEHEGRTQLVDTDQVTICGAAPALAPVTVTLPVASNTDLERFEGMWVTFPQTLVVTETFTLGRYGEVVLASERLSNPTNVTAPGASAAAMEAQNDLKRIVLDDGSRVENPDPVEFPGSGLTFDNTLRGGDTVTGINGVIDYYANGYRIHATNTPAWVHTNPRPTAPSVGGSLRVASFNVLNYFNGDGAGGGFPTSRGASTRDEFTRQRTKIINAIMAMNPDIIGVIEMENDGYGSDSAIQDLVNGLNAAAPSGTTYAFIDPGVDRIGGDEITVGMIYRIQTVTPVGQAQINEEGAFSSLNRVPLAQTFRQTSTGGMFTYVVNHFKSKGSECPGDADAGDGQGNCNQTRVNAAQELTAWLASDPTGSNDPDFLIAGDLNAYAMEDPITAIKNAGYTNLIEQFLGSLAYSYVFMGQAGYLDHALASASLTPQVAGVLQWHINADEPIVLDYNVEFKSSGQVNSLYGTAPNRSSDHDPVLVGLDLTP